MKKGDKNYGKELARRFTNRNRLYNDGYKLKYVPQNDNHGDALYKVIYNLKIDLSQFLKKKLYVVESAQDKIFCIKDKYIHFTRVEPLYV